MRLFQTIKEIIFKIKDYDRVESDYSSVLDYATGGVLSKTNYTLESVYDAIRYNVQKHDEYVEHDYLEQLKKGALDCSIIYHPNDSFAKYSISAYVPPLHKASSYISHGDKLKLIIIKEDQP